MLRPPLDPFEAALAASLRDLGLRDGDGVVVAFSGGPDSLALLAALPRAAPGLRPVAAHLDHGLRRGSAAGAARARRLARALGIPFRTRRARGLRPAGGASPEPAARAARYAFLAAVARDRGARAVLTAHQRDDRVETVLHRLLQGATLGGLAGIPPRRPLPGAPGTEVLRPLLDRRRDEIESYLARRRLRPVLDPTNRGEGNARARLRGRVLPALRRDYPGADGALLRLEALARDAAALAGSAAARAVSGARRLRGGGVSAPRAGFERLGTEALRRALGLLLQRAGARRTAPPEAALLRVRAALDAGDAGTRLVPVGSGATLEVGPRRVTARAGD